MKDEIIIDAVMKQPLIKWEGVRHLFPMWKTVIAGYDVYLQCNNQTVNINIEGNYFSDITLYKLPDTIRQFENEKSKRENIYAAFAANEPGN